MNFLKKLGSIVLKIIGLWTGFSPLLGSAVSASGTATKVIGEVTQAFGVIGTVEQMFTAAYGPDAKLPSQKLAAAVPFVAQLIQQTDLLAGKKPKDEALFTQGATDFTNALVKILNSYGE
jgi:hypothetical protein